MKLCLFKPFDELSGRREIAIDLPKAILVKELLGIIQTRIPALEQYVRAEGNEVSSFFLILVRGDELLRLEDRVEDGDVIKVLPPLSGG